MPDGVITTVVPEAEFERLRAEGQAHDLVPEAYTEHRYVAEELLHARAGGGDRGRIARSIGKEHAVGCAREDVGARCRGRNDLDLTTRADELVEDRTLDPEVVRDHEESRIVGSDRVRLGRRNDGREVASVGTAVGFRRGEQRVAIGDAERPGDRAGAANVTREAAGVDPGN